MEVLIVSKTRMADSACVGGIVFPTYESVRLLQHDGSYQPLNTDFEIGQFWEIEYRPASNITRPHIEDVHVLKKEKLNKTFNDYEQLINSSKLKNKIWRGTAKELFERKLRWTGNRNGYISKNAIPSMSTGFWIPDKDLTFGDKHYTYKSDGLFKQSYGLSYVGFQKAIDTIPADTIIRVSLAKWWRPKDSDMELRCYLQLSGWYE